MRLVVAGAEGRMGQTLIRLINDEAGVVLAGALERPESGAIGKDAGVVAGSGQLGVHITADIEGALSDADAIVDFTAPAATVAMTAAAAKAGVAHVIGTTGLTGADHQAIDAAAERTVIVQAGNMSLGVNLLAQFVRKAAEALDATFDVEISEMHHRHKTDAPSGTALLFGRAAADGRGIDLADRSVRSRDGHVGPRRAGDIGFASLRGGTTVGDHTVIFAGDGETIELTHRAFDRAIFAHGAIKAAQWARGRAPGRYSMADVLGLQTEKLS